MKKRIVALSLLMLLVVGCNNCPPCDACTSVQDPTSVTPPTSETPTSETPTSETPTSETVKAPKVVQSPVAGVAYKLGLIHDEGHVQYFNGEMDTYYGATVTVFEDGVDVKLEETTGGYYLSFEVGGAKKYINIKKNGTYYNFTIENSGSSVWVYEASLDSYVTQATDIRCALGTQIGKNHKTVSPVQEKYFDTTTNRFVHFYELG